MKRLLPWRPILCQALLCARIAVWRVSHATAEGEKHDGWYCNLHTKSRVMDNTLMGHATIHSKSL